MAHGYAMVSGRTPAVMVHTIAGTANAVGGLINATRSQVPMFFTAGRTPLAEDDAVGVATCTSTGLRSRSIRGAWSGSG